MKDFSNHAPLIKRNGTSSGLSVAASAICGKLKALKAKGGHIHTAFIDCSLTDRLNGLNPPALNHPYNL